MSVAIIEQATELAWRQWTLLGVRGVAPPPDSALDLEALIAFTPWVAADDPRLAAEAADWCARIGPQFVSVSRLRRIQRELPAPAERPAIDLFALLSDRAVAARFHGSGKSRAPSLEHPALLQLRARMIFGVGARADVLARLVMLEVGDDAEPASLRALHPPGYTRQAIAPVLAELTAGGLLRRSKAAHAVGYRLRDPATLRALLGPLPGHTPNWLARLFAVSTAIATWRSFGERRTYAIELAKAFEHASPRAPAIAWPTLAGQAAEVVDMADRWVISLLDRAAAAGRARS